MIAVELTAKFRNKDLLHFGTGYKDQRARAKNTWPYPPGQVLRGRFGYLLMNMQSDIVDSFKDGIPLLYFKDALVYHKKCGGLLYPTIEKQRFLNYKCNNCNEILRYATRISTVNKTRMSRQTYKVNQLYRLQMISNYNKFRLKIIIKLKNNEKRFEDPIAIMEFARNFGLNFGGRCHKGIGKLFIEDYQLDVISDEMINQRAEELCIKKKFKIHLLSQYIPKQNNNTNFLTVKDFLTSIKNAGKFFLYDYTNYPDPKLKLIDSQTRKPIKINFFDTNRFISHHALPEGSQFDFEIENAPFIFWKSLAVAEKCSGIGARTSFGKGEFIIT
ncbi:MAG: hypothetical protein EAX96_06195 [Candidatus Lokiarchaeota archaeon]|nr:hypothetical protein [Candidatus Lokiarchaeota archaeon]